MPSEPRKYKIYGIHLRLAKYRLWVWWSREKLYPTGGLYISPYFSFGAYKR